MPSPTVVGIFDSPDDAEKVKEELLDAGVAAHRIAVGPVLAEDGVAAEAVVAVVARSHVDKKHIAELMRRYGARDTVEARP